MKIDLKLFNCLNTSEDPLLPAKGITDEQFAARDLVRSWAAAAAAAAVREAEHDADAWRRPCQGLAELGIFSVAVPEEQGGADGTVEDLCAIDEGRGRAGCPGGSPTTALAWSMPTRLCWRRWYPVSAQPVRPWCRPDAAPATSQTQLCRAPPSLSSVRTPPGCCCCPPATAVVLVDAVLTGVSVELLTATDFSLPLAGPGRAGRGARAGTRCLAATVLRHCRGRPGAEAAGLARWTPCRPPPSTRRCASSSASRSAASRPSSTVVDEQLSLSFGWN